MSRRGSSGSWSRRAPGGDDKRFWDLACSESARARDRQNSAKTAGFCPIGSICNRETLQLAGEIYLRALGAHHTAQVATRTRTVDVQVAHAFTGEEAPNGILEFASIHNIGANHHGRFVISTK